MKAVLQGMLVVTMLCSMCTAGGQGEDIEGHWCVTNIEVDEGGAKALALLVGLQREGRLQLVFEDSVLMILDEEEGMLDDAAFSRFSHGEKYFLRTNQGDTAELVFSEPGLRLVWPQATYVLRRCD